MKNFHKFLIIFLFCQNVLSQSSVNDVKEISMNYLIEEGYIKVEHGRSNGVNKLEMISIHDLKDYNSMNTVSDGLYKLQINRSHTDEFLLIIENGGYSITNTKNFQTCFLRSIYFLKKQDIEDIILEKYVNGLSNLLKSKKVNDNFITPIDK